MPNFTLNMPKVALPKPALPVSVASLKNTVKNSVKAPSFNVQSALVNRASSLKRYIPGSVFGMRPRRLQTATATISTDAPESAQPACPTAAYDGSCELVVVALLYITADDKMLSPISRGLNNQFTCMLRRGSVTKTSNAGRLAIKTKKLIFNDKFIFKRASQDDKYGSVHLEMVNAAAAGLLSSGKVGELVVDLDVVLKEAKSNIPLRKTCAMKGSASDRIAHYVVHRIPVLSVEAANALDAMEQASHSLDDEEDLARYGQVFPDLWYAIPEEHE